jgi:hypothetical protein
MFVLPTHATRLQVVQISWLVIGIFDLRLAKLSLFPN